MAKQYRSDALAAVHETALGLHEAGVMDRRTLKGFDEMCLTPVEQLTPEQIRHARAKFAGQEGPVDLRSGGITDLVYRHNIADLLTEVCEYLRLKNEVWVLIDNLDKGWPTTRVSAGDIAIVRTLLKAT